jgi:hypothetical protein
VTNKTVPQRTNQWAPQIAPFFFFFFFGTKNKTCDPQPPNGPGAFSTSHDATQVFTMPASCASNPWLSCGLRVFAGGAVWTSKSGHEGAGRGASPGGKRP